MNSDEIETSLRRQLRDQAERLELALDAAKLGTWEHVPRTHATYWDARSKAIFGLEADEDLTFERYAAAIHPADLERVLAGINKAMDPASGGQCTLQYRIHVGGQSWRWVEAHGRCTFDGDKPLRINGTLLDITENKQAEEALREAARRKDEFLAVLGHELRNPLAPIQTALDLMRAKYPDVAEREREVIDRQLKHMLRLVDDLLDLGRVTRGALTLKLRTTDLQQAIRHAVELSSPLFEAKHHHLRVDVPAGLRVSVDSVRFAQIVANLLTNAAKFTDPGGQIAVSARADGAHVDIAIEDNGRGIAAEELERIFQPFVQAQAGASSTQGGLGLGLALVRDLALLHGGSVTAQSDGIGRGSCFVLRMPLVTEEIDEQKSPVRSRPPESGKRILLVDDNEDAVEMMAQLLAGRGHLVRSARDGMTALAIASEHQPEVAVLDLGLPLMDGFEVAQRLLALLAPRTVELIALTGYGQPEDRARTRAAGFRWHLVKPVDFDDLVRAIEVRDMHAATQASEQLE